jgi:hypothetical protein
MLSNVAFFPFLDAVPAQHSAQMDKLVPVLCSNQDGHCEPGLFRIRSQEALMIESQAQDRHS